MFILETTLLVFTQFIKDPKANPLGTHWVLQTINLVVVVVVVVVVETHWSQHTINIPTLLYFSSH